ncbi:MAG: terpene cyclase/mutase family protein [Syntrophomonadaceae bacterium]|nr:terpene cyclase/mutase family protein [Syntrophomonadaceae bacterium]
MKNKLRMVLLLALMLIFTIPGIGIANTANAPNPESVDRALLYLHSVQNSDGGFPSAKGGVSSNAVTSWVLMALAASGEDIKAKEWAPAGNTALNYLQSCKQPLTGSCDYARTLLGLKAVKAAGKYQNQDLIQKIASCQQSSGQYGQLSKGEKSFINTHMWSVIALYSAGQEITNKAKARDWLLKVQNKDGGFGWCEGLASDADDTAVALQVLVLLGENPSKSASISKALSYLKTCQKEDGGFSSSSLYGNKSNASTDSWVIQGLLACGENPKAEKWSVKGKNAVTHLLSLQSQSGYFNWIPKTAASPVITTAYAVMALKGTALPVNLKSAAGKSK